jgi:hypothetical protein
MDMPDFKTLKKLAFTCRKLGIKTIRLGDLEVTLSDYEPTKRSYKVRAKGQPVVEGSSTPDDIDSDELSEDQLLFWSAGNPEEEKAE